MLGVKWVLPLTSLHYYDVIMGTLVSQIISLTVVFPTVYWGADQRKHQRTASLAFVRGIHRGPFNSPHKWPATRKMFPFDDVIMALGIKVSNPRIRQYVLYFAVIMQSIFSKFLTKDTALLARYMGSLLSVLSLIKVLNRPLLFCMFSHISLDRVIMAPDSVPLFYM